MSVEEVTWDGYKYFVTVLDDFTHFAGTFLLRAKSDVCATVTSYIKQIENHWSQKVCKIRLDNGGEFVCKEFKRFCDDRGISLDYTPAYTPQLNSHAERLGRTLMDKTRALLFDASHLGKEMWGEALLTATYLLNRSPTKAVKTTPAKMWFKKKPDLSRLRVFGSICYAKNLKYVKKLDSKTKKYIFIGYMPNSY